MGYEIYFVVIVLFILICKCIYIIICIHTYINISIFICIHIYIYIYIYILFFIYIYIYIISKNILSVLKTFTLEKVVFDFGSHFRHNFGQNLNNEKNKSGISGNSTL